MSSTGPNAAHEATSTRASDDDRAAVASAVRPGPPTDRKFTDVAVEFGPGPLGMQVDNGLVVRVVMEQGAAKSLGVREGDQLAQVASDSAGKHVLVGLPHDEALAHIKAASRPMQILLHRPLSSSTSGVGSSASSQPQLASGANPFLSAAASLVTSMRTASSRMAQGATEMARKTREGFGKLQERISEQVAGQRLGPDRDPDHESMQALRAEWVAIGNDADIDAARIQESATALDTRAQQARREVVAQQREFDLLDGCLQQRLPALGAEVRRMLEVATGLDGRVRRSVRRLNELQARATDLRLRHEEGAMAREQEAREARQQRVLVDSEIQLERVRSREQQQQQKAAAPSVTSDTQAAPGGLEAAGAADSDRDVLEDAETEAQAEAVAEAGARVGKGGIGPGAVAADEASERAMVEAVVADEDGDATDEGLAPPTAAGVFSSGPTIAGTGSDAAKGEQECGHAGSGQAGSAPEGAEQQDEMETGDLAADEDDVGKEEQGEASAAAVAAAMAAAAAVGAGGGEVPVVAGGESGVPPEGSAGQGGAKEGDDGAKTGAGNKDGEGEGDDDGGAGSGHATNERRPTVMDVLKRFEGGKGKAKKGKKDKKEKSEKKDGKTKKAKKEKKSKAKKDDR